MPSNTNKDYVAEHLEVTQSREFTIVGVIERPNMEIEDYSALIFLYFTAIFTDNCLFTLSNKVITVYPGAL